MELKKYFKMAKKYFYIKIIFENRAITKKVIFYEVVRILTGHPVYLVRPNKSQMKKIDTHY
jgi:hypothetical protein